MTAVLLATLSAPAHAEVLHHRDQRHDVWRFNGKKERIAPHAANPDLTRVTIRHAAKRVVVKIAARKMTRRTDLATLKIVTPQGHYWVAAFLNPTFVTVMKHNRDVACPRATAHRSLPRNRMTITVPRRCLDTPRWVKIGGGVIKTGPGGTAEKGHLDLLFGGKPTGERVLVSPRVLSS